MSESAYEWGGEHFCEPDTRHLYNTEPRRITDPEIGYPVELDQAPETFCSVCLLWWGEPHDEGSEHRPPPEKGTTDD